MCIRASGITRELLVGQPTTDTLLPALQSFCADTVLVGHTAAFDMRFLQLKEKQTGVRFEQPVLDTLLPVSYTHLDVYKRQAPAGCASSCGR